MAENKEDLLKEEMNDSTDTPDAEDTPVTEENVAAEDAEETADSDVSEKTDGDPGQEEEAAGAEKGRKFFKKDKKDKKDVQIEELTDKYKRTMAEFDNFRKRTEKEKTAMYEIGAKDIIEKMLPIVDNFERGLATLSEEEKASPFADGMDKVYKQLLTALEDAGVKVIEAVGKEFDPNLHNAVMHVEDESLGENVVAEEFQKGYTYRESVVRHSMVKVAN